MISSGVGGTNLVKDFSPLQTFTDTTTLNIQQEIILCNKATAMTVNLPSAVGISGKVFVIKNINVGTVTIDASGTQTIDGQETQTISFQYNSYTIVSNGANWFII